jgi:hypothetical protein
MVEPTALIEGIVHAQRRYFGAAGHEFIDEVRPDKAIRPSYQNISIPIIQGLPLSQASLSEMSVSRPDSMIITHRDASQQCLLPLLLVPIAFSQTQTSLVSLYGNYCLSSRKRLLSPSTRTH